MRLALVALLLPAACATAHAHEIDALPLRAGTSWTYRGTVTVPAPEDPARVVQKPVTLVVTVREVERAEGGGEVARVEGDLSDLDFWQEGRKPSIVYLVHRGARYYRARAPGTPGELFLELPLEPGARVCPDRDDERLCWLVERIDRAALPRVTGAPRGERPRYFLIQRDNTGTQEIELVAGVGITAYRYHHHGSTSEVDVRLTELRVGR